MSRTVYPERPVIAVAGVIFNDEGKVVWIFSCNASVNDVEEYGDFVYASSTDGRMYAINKSNGKVEFSFAPMYEIEGTYNYITTPLSNIIAFNGKTFLSAGGKIYCLDAETVEKESTKESGHSISKIAGGMAVFIIIIIAAIIIKKYR